MPSVAAGLAAVILAALLFGYPAVAAAVVAVVASLLLHEFGHALSARRHGLEVLWIAVKPIGAAAYLWGPVESARVYRKLASAGVAISLVLALAGAGAVWVSGSSRLLFAAAATFAIFNTLLAALNALPIRPCDGSRVIVGLLWQRSGSKERAEELLGRIELALFALFPLAGLVLLLAGRYSYGIDVAAFALVLIAQRALVLRDQAKIAAG